MRRLFVVFAAVLVVAGTAGSQSSQWRRGAPVPVARTEVVAATLGKEIAVVGGYLEDGSSTSRADLYSPSKNRWRRLPDLPVAVNHSTAATYKGRLYVVGGYGQNNQPLRSAFVLRSGSWRRLPDLPEPRAAAGAAFAGGKLYIAGGVRGGSPRLAQTAYVLDPARGSWSEIPGPTPREHLAVTAAKGRVYVLAGRLSGLNTNRTDLEVYSAKDRRWTRLPPVPEARGGTAAASSGNTIVSAGGEAPGGTIASVYAFNVTTRRWRRLSDLPTPRHGLGMASLGGRVYALAGGAQPGLFVSNANEYLQIRR